MLFHTDLSRERGMSNGVDLSRLNWGNYDLIVIDESHNFRNGGKVTTDEDDENPRENRYLRLMNQVIRAGPNGFCPWQGGSVKLSKDHHAAIKEERYIPHASHA